MSEQLSTEQKAVLHYGPVYRSSGPFGESLAACRPGDQPSNLTVYKPWVTCAKCKQTEAYRYGK